MESRRVVITGRGVCLPNANNVNSMMDNLRNCRSSIENVSPRFPWLNGYRCQLASFFDDKWNFNAIAEKLKIPLKDIKRYPPFGQYSMYAAYQAINESGFLEHNPDETRERTGVIVGMGLSGMVEIEKQKEKQLAKGIDKVSSMVCIKSIPDAPAGLVTCHWELHGPSKSVSSACATGADSINDGYNLIKEDVCDVALAGGTVEAATPIIYAGFGQIYAMSQRNNDSLHASRPFDRDRDGFVIGEGCGLVVLEELGHAKKRGAVIYGELVGYGATSDGYHPTSPRPDAKYIAKAMRDAITRAGIKPEQIGYINAHGTSTPDNDGIETFGIKQVFGEYAKKIPISSTKSMIGHTLSAAGALEFIVALETVAKREDGRGVIHPTANLEHPDVDVNYHKDFNEEQIKNFQPCDLDYVPNQARVVEGGIDYALSNSFGFFGHNVALVVGRYQG